VWAVIGGVITLFLVGLVAERKKRSGLECLSVAAARTLRRRVEPVNPKKDEESKRGRLEGRKRNYFSCQASLRGLQGHASGGEGGGGVGSGKKKRNRAKTKKG